ncbi:ABC transporter ATP-binding protein [Modicisalibacter coralii]|uniref:ABC transporter ATP-binding protein n=1 Tax=Modicisalibacter coralii TaxID=2304602 RepID=UPI00100AE8F3|nr:ABC transporter ATP-binding protein [Halomonas coralii]
MRPSESDAALLRIEDLRIEVDKEGTWSEILHGVSVALKRGEILGVIGESGAGKSTIGLAALGYTRNGGRFSGGKVFLDGVEMLSAPTAILEKMRGTRVAYVAQSAASHFNPAHTIGAQFAEVLRLRTGMKKQDIARKAADLYAELGLPDPETIGNRYPHQLSGGQLQRAMIAMAMATDPDLLVFDEPTTALDVTTQLDVLGCVKRVLDRAGAAALYISHDLALVAQLADRIMVMRNGDMVETGATREMLANPRQTYTRELLEGLQTQRDAVFVPEPDTQPLLRLDHLSASYSGSEKVLDDVTVHVHRGETVAIVGESGSGKSTLTRSICGLLPPMAGEMLFDDAVLPPRLDRRQPDTLKRIQLVHQLPDLALNSAQRIGTIIGRPLKVFQGLTGRAQAQRVTELLEMLELPASYARRYPAQLSGGEKQRVAIARALAADPALLICDEVTSALDQLVAAGVLRILRRLKQELSLGMIFITHDMATVREIADTVIVMRQGKVVNRGSVHDVLNDPDEPYTRELVAAAPEMDPDWITRVRPNFNNRRRTGT